MQTLTLFTNSFITALALILVIIVSLQLGAPLRGALLIGFAFGFGSYAFAYAKTFGSEPGAALCLIAAVMFAIEAARSGRLSMFIACGLFAGSGVFFRVTSGIFLPVFALWFFVIMSQASNVWRGLRYAAFFSAGALGSLVVLAVFNVWRYGSPINLGYGQNTPELGAVRVGPSIATGLWGQWLSPGKSVFLYAPFVILGVCGLVISVRRLPREMALLIALVVVNTLFFARVKFWAGDWAWGPRYMVIVMPCLAVMCAPLVERVRWRRSLAGLAALGLLVPGLLGVAVNFNVYYLRARGQLGPQFLAKVRREWYWNPIGRTVGVLADAVGNLGKPAGLVDLSGSPRLDIWWLDNRWWLTQHPARIVTAVLILLFIVGLIVGGLKMVLPSLRREDSVGRARTQRLVPGTALLKSHLG